jgi:acyl-CoA hydrolase
MRKITKASDIINSTYIKPGSLIYVGGNAAVPQELIRQLARDPYIYNIDLLSILMLGDVEELFTQETCQRIKHRIIFSGPYSREALNKGWATYQLMHLSDIPNQIQRYLKPNICMFTVSGPDNGGNYSFGTTVEGVQSAVHSIRENGGLVIVEKNKQMPFVLGTTIHESEIDYMFETDYPLPVTPVQQSDSTAIKIGRIVTDLYITNGCTLQFGIGEVPEAVTDAIIQKGVKDIGIYTELFSDAMRKLVEKGVVTNRYLEVNFSTASIFLSNSREGYEWLNFNSSVQSRPCNITNNILNIAKQHKMTAINSAIGVDLHGNIWADSLKGREIYSGIGGQADFLRGSYLSEGGFAIIAMKSTTSTGISKILDMSPEGITTTAISADPVVIVTENGAFNPRGLNISEHAVGIAHLAEPVTRQKLLKVIYDSPEFHKPREALKNKSPKGFISYDEIT